MAIATSTIAAIAAIAAVAGTAVTVVGMQQQGQAQKKVANYNAKIAENAAISKRYEAEAQANKIRERAKRIRSTQITNYSKSGVTLSGSVNDVMYDSSLAAENDVLISLYEGKTASSNLHSQAALSRFEGKQAVINANYGSAGTLLSGVAEAGSYYNQSKNLSRVNAQPTID
jgi:hypothetical protein